MRDAESIENCGHVVRSNTGLGDFTGFFDFRRPNHDGRDANATLVEVAFATAEVTGTAIVGAVIVFRAIIRAEPNHGVVCDAFIGKMFSEAANLFIHGCDTTRVVTEVDGVTFIHFLMTWTSHTREVRRVKPNNGEEGLLVSDRLVNKGKNAIHNDAAIITFKIVSDFIAFDIPIESPVGLRFFTFFDVLPAEAFTFPFIKFSG